MTDVNHEETLHLPAHIAIILDGNGRWAKRRGMPRSYGHIVGTDNLEKMCNLIADMGVRYLTVYAFSTENWKRSVEEVGTLMNLFRKYLKRIEKSAHRRSMRVRVIGDKQGLPEDLQARISELEAVTAGYDKMDFQIALNYGGRDELLRAAKRIAKDAARGALDADALSMDDIEARLDTAGIPDPDLLIRTGGEQRISNFLLWQLAYTEFYFTEIAWPDFHREELMDAIAYYQKRERRFGDAK